MNVKDLLNFLVYIRSIELELYVVRFAVCSTDSIMFLHHMTATLQHQIHLIREIKIYVTIKSTHRPPKMTLVLAADSDYLKTDSSENVQRTGEQPVRFQVEPTLG